MSSSTTRRARPTSRAPPRRPGITWSGWWTRAAAGASRSRRDRALRAHLARPAIAAEPEIHGVAHEPLARPFREAHLAHQHRPHPVAPRLVGVAQRSGSRQGLAEEGLAAGEREAAEIPPEEGQAVVEVRRRRHPGGRARALAHQVHAALQALEARASLRIERDDFAV